MPDLDSGGPYQPMQVRILSGAPFFEICRCSSIAQSERLSNVPMRVGLPPAALLQRTDELGSLTAASPIHDLRIAPALTI